MKIAFFIESLDPRRGGRETSTIQVATELSKRGHEVSIFCQSSAADAAASYRVVCLPTAATGKLASLKDFIRQSQEIIRAGGFDITQSVLPIPLGRGPTPLRRMGETPLPRYIYQPRGGIVPVQWEGSLRRRGPLLRGPVRVLQLFRRRQQYLAELERQVMRDDRACILAVSHLVAEDVQRHYGRSGGVKVVFNAVSVPGEEEDRVAGVSPASFSKDLWRREIREKLRLPANGLLVLTVANNPRLKGFEETLTAFLEFWSSSAAPSGLICLGLKGQPTELSPGEPVQLLGHVSDVFRYYSAADVVMLLSWQDACSRVVLEAVRWGVPCITTRYNGAAEVLVDGAGIVVDSPADTAAVVSALTRVADAARREAMSRACLAKADYLSIGRHVDELEQLYRELV